MWLSKFEIVALAALETSALKVGVISDLHVNQKYDLYGKTSNCWVGIDMHEKPSPWARYGCDPSADFVDAMLRHYVDSFGYPDILLVNGDNVAHHVDVARGYGSDAQYQAVKDNIAASYSIVKKYFPDTIIL